MKFNKSSGQASRVLIILAIVLLMAIVVVYVALNVAKNRQSQSSQSGESSEETVNEPPKPVYEATLGDVKFLFESAKDLGSTLEVPENYVGYEHNLTTTDKFIEVVVKAQNKGKNDLMQYSWNLGNVIDSEGRNFIASTRAYFWIPRPDLCGSILKPDFEPTPCLKVYEISKESKDLKVEVKVTSPKAETALIDLDLK